MDYLITTTFTMISHLTDEEAIELALRGRGEGKRTELANHERARELGLNEPMQDLTKIKSSEGQR